MTLSRWEPRVLEACQHGKKTEKRTNIQCLGLNVNNGMYLVGVCIVVVAILSGNVVSCASVAGPAPVSAGVHQRDSTTTRAMMMNDTVSVVSDMEINLQRIREENDWKNSLVQWMWPESLQEVVFSGHNRFVSSWARNWMLATGLYFVVGGLWAYYCYYCFGDSLYPSKDHIPSIGAMVEQMKVAFFAMPLYALLPAFTEYIVEQGWTLSYARIDDVGIAKYILYFALYMTSVEFFVYWQHRLLHDIRPGYKYLHHIHHIYNKEHTLSPFAGLAFHPLDGILQAVPYTWTLFFVPMHFLTHELLLFATAIWTTNIHDCLHVRMDPIMGAGYHTIHHTTYKHNYGHYLWYMDALMGTLIYPEDYQEKKTNMKKNGR